MKYIIKWDVGYGPNFDVVDAVDEDAATNMAYEEWREEAEQNADYGAVPWTQELEDESL